MNWINNVVRPKIRSFLEKRETPDNLWIQCPVTGEMVFHRDLEANQYVIPGSGHHMRMPAEARLASLPLDSIPNVAALPTGSVMPLAANPLFVGREADLTKLAKALRSSGTATIGQIAAVSGLAVFELRRGRASGSGSVR